MVEEEGDVLLRKHLSVLMSHHVNGMMSNISCVKKGESD